MKPAQFSYFRPRTSIEALEMMSAAGEDARFLAGGQSLVPMMNFRIVRPSALIDLSDCVDLDYARERQGKVHIGAMMRQRTAETNEVIRRFCPLIAQALSHAGPATVRNRATVGGTIANGYPIAELPVVAACLEAEMVLMRRPDERRVPAAEFFIAGMVTAIEPGELLKEIVLPAAGPATCYGFAECGNHAGGAALAIAAACGERRAGGHVEAVKVAVAGLQSIPLRLPNVEQAVVGKSSLEVAFAADLAEIERLDGGIEADAEQRKLVRVVLEDAIAQMCVSAEVAA